MYEKPFSHYEDLFNTLLNSGNTCTIKRIEGVSKEDLKNIIKEVMFEPKNKKEEEEAFEPETNTPASWEEEFPICKINSKFSDVLENEHVVFAGRSNWPRENTIYLGEDDTLYYAYKGEKTRIPYKADTEDYMAHNWFMRMPHTIRTEPHKE